MKTNILFALLANLVNAGFSWIMLIFIIRFGGKEDIGMFGLAQAIALPIHMFFTLKLRTIQLSDVNHKFQEKDYIGSRLYLAVANLIFTAFIVLVFYFDHISYMVVICSLALSYSVAVFREYYISVYQINELNKYFFISNLIQGFISVLVFSLVFFLTRNIVYSILFYSISKFILIFLDGFFYRKISDKSSYKLLYDFLMKKNNFINLVKIGLPLGITSVISAFFTSIPRFQLERFYGLEVLGVFTTVMSLVVILNLFMSSFIQAILPRMTKSYLNNIKIFLLSTLKFLMLMSIFSSIFLLICNYFSFYILYFVFGNSYTSYQSEFFLAMVSGVVLCYFHFSNFLLNVQRTYKEQGYIYIIAAIVCFLSSYYLIPIYGILGAIYATIFCSLSGILGSIFIFYVNLKKI